MNKVKDSFFKELKAKYGPIKKLGKSQSLFEFGDGAGRLYIRYSKLHNNRAFYGLRKVDLKELEGYNSLICFLWKDQAEPLLIPFSEYEDLFQIVKTAEDGQYKVQIFINDSGLEFYIPKLGRFNVEGYAGWKLFDEMIDSNRLLPTPELSHPQLQTLIGSIGYYKGYDIWIPQNDRLKLDWTITKEFGLLNFLPYKSEDIKSVLQNIDIIWIQRGSNILKALFEVEYSTPIYSGLMRFNDILLYYPEMKPKFTIVSDYSKKSNFTRQISRPTFKLSGLDKICNFIDYTDVFRWHDKILHKANISV